MSRPPDTGCQLVCRKNSTDALTPHMLIVPMSSCKSAPWMAVLYITRACLKQKTKNVSSCSSQFYFADLTSPLGSFFISDSPDSVAAARSGVVPFLSLLGGGGFLLASFLGVFGFFFFVRP